MSDRHFIQIVDNGQVWLFVFDHSPRSLLAFFDVLIAYERDPESGFKRCHANLALDALSRQLLATVASRRTVVNSKTTVIPF